MSQKNDRQHSPLPDEHGEEGENQGICLIFVIFASFCDKNKIIAGSEESKLRNVSEVLETSGASRSALETSGASRSALETFGTSLGGLETSGPTLTFAEIFSRSISTHREASSFQQKAVSESLGSSTQKRSKRHKSEPDDDILEVLTRAGLDHRFKLLLSLYGIKTLEDLKFVNSKVLDTLETRIKQNGFIGKVDLRLNYAQKQYLGYTVASGQLSDFEIDLLDREKLLNILPSVVKGYETELERKRIGQKIYKKPRTLL